VLQCIALLPSGTQQRTRLKPLVADPFCGPGIWSEGSRFHLASRTSVRYGRTMADLSPEEAEILRRSIAMLPPQAPSGLSRERALAILGQLVRALRELRRR